ncbi:MAG: type II secretion system F family protein [Firmicutes bacterium]|nr:type II secretion system F family protein [Bacillota bacterium]
MLYLGVLLSAAAAFFTVGAWLPLRRNGFIRARLHSKDARRQNKQGIESGSTGQAGRLNQQVRTVLEGLGRPVERLIPLKHRENLALRLFNAGTAVISRPAGFLGAQLALSLAFPAVLAVLVRPGPWTLLCAACLGAYLPLFWLGRLIVRRRRRMSRVLPFAMDLLAVSVEAGLGFDAALAKVVEKAKGPLVEEFFRTLQEMRMGKSRREALRSLAHRVELPELTSFVITLIQADQLGTSIARILRILSEQMRTKRGQQAEAMALRTPVKMLFPMIFFIFPALLVILFGPVFLSGIFR